MKFCNAPNCSNPVFGKGFCRNHQYKREDFDGRSILQKGIAKHKEQQKVKPKGWFKLEDEVDYMLVKEERGGGELQRWFEERRKEMTGICQNCGGKTQAFNTNYKNSIAHILPKAYFKSVATHPSNSIELCFYGKSCHTNLDNKMLDLIEMACWDEIVTKFCIMYPSIDKKERRRIPNLLLQYIQTEI